MSSALRALLSLTFLTVSVVAAAPAHSTDTDAWDGDWHGSFTPYGWLPGVTA